MLLIIKYYCIFLGFFNIIYILFYLIYFNIRYKLIKLGKILFCIKITIKKISVKLIIKYKNREKIIKFK